MLYVNDGLGPFGKLFYDSYIATSIDDFLESMSELNAPSLFRTLSPFIFLTSIRGIFVEFQNIHIITSEDFYFLSDMSGSLTVTKPDRIHTLAVNNTSAITSGRYSSADIKYDPHSGKAYMVSATRDLRTDTSPDMEVDIFLRRQLSVQ